VLAFFLSNEVLAVLATAATGLVGAGLKRHYGHRDEKAAKATELLGRYRDPLLGAAYELQSRLFNIVQGKFLHTYRRRGRGVLDRYPIDSTLWTLGQYLGWVEILRREVQFLDLGHTEANRDVQDKLARITGILASDHRRLSGRLRVWRAHQRAIGEVMIVREPQTESARATCLGYVEFVAKRSDPEFWKWFAPLERDLMALAGAPARDPRLVALQRALVDLLDLLDEERVRFPAIKTRGRLPVRAAEPPPVSPELQLADFALDPVHGDVHDVFGEWAASRRLALRSANAGSGVAVGTLRSLSRRVRFELYEADGQIMLGGYALPPRWQVAVKLAPERVPLDSRARKRWWWTRRRGRKHANKLLERLDQPAVL
jgi:hypothetical protein